VEHLGKKLNSWSAHGIDKDLRNSSLNFLKIPQNPLLKIPQYSSTFLPFPHPNPTSSNQPQIYFRTSNLLSLGVEKREKKERRNR